MNGNELLTKTQAECEDVLPGAVTEEISVGQAPSVSIDKKNTDENKKNDALAGQKKQKNYGIELLRILSMYFIVILHVIGQGGVASYSGILTPQYKASYIMLAFAYCAVNCYALISGYVSCKSKFRLSRLVSLWLSVVATNAVIWVITYLYNPEWVAGNSFINNFLPVSKNQYWYFTAYVGLMILMPALNAAVNNISKKHYTFMLIGMFVLFSLLPVQSKADLYYTHSGYSLFWLVLMYLTGAYFKLHFNQKLPLFKCICLAVYIISAFGLAMHRFYKENQLIEAGNSYPFYGDYYTYTSFFVVICSVALFLLFMHINVKNRYIGAFIEFFSKSTFGVYIIHTNIIVWMFVLGGRFIEWSLLQPHMLVLHVLAASVVIFLICTAVEKIRALTFKLLFIDKLVGLLDRIGTEKKN